MWEKWCAISCHKVIVMSLSLIMFGDLKIKLVFEDTGSTWNLFPVNNAVLILPDHVAVEAKDVMEASPHSKGAHFEGRAIKHEAHYEESVLGCVQHIIEFLLSETN